jgi:two-component system sensor histidine kinase/response regulator
MNTRALYAHDDPAELVSVLVSFRDISRYRATEQSLRRREEIYRAIVSQALDAIVLIDLESQRFVEFNDAAYLGLGYSREEFARLHVNDIHERHADETFEQELAERYMSRLRAGEGVVMEHPHIARDGSRRNVRVSMRYLKIADKEYLAGIWSDITERTQIDAELARYRAELEDQVELRTAELEQTNRELRAARDAAEEASRAKNEFVQQISEQLRGPVQEITERLRDSQSAVIDEELHRQLAAMASAGDRLRGIIERMAGFSWMEGDELLLTPVAFALSTLLARTLDEQRVLAEEKGLQLQWRRDSGLPDQVVGDPVWLGQVLAGLLRNAVQYSERGQVALRCLRLYRGGSQLWLRFEVEDQGRGMTAEQQERLSDYLQMTDMAVGAGSSGIGSGLALARRVTALMGGQMGLVSTLGRGSLFWLELNLPETDSDASAGGDAFGSGQA